MKVPVYTTCLNDHVMLVEEKELEYQYNGHFSDSESIAFMMTEAFHMNQFAEEYVYMLAFTNSLSLIGVSEVFHGTVFVAVILIYFREFFWMGIPLLLGQWGTILFYLQTAEN